MAAELFEQHRQIIAMTEELLLLVRRVPRADIEEIAQLRARLAIVGIAHLQREDELIMAPLMASGRAAELPGVETIIGMVRESRRYTADHAGRWSMRAVEEDREGYAEALVVMIDYVRMLTAREEEELYLPALRMLDAEASAGIH